MDAKISVGKSLSDHALSIPPKTGNISRKLSASMKSQKRCKWNEIDRLKRPNRVKRTTFFPVTFHLARLKVCVPYIFYPELPESLCQW